MKETLGKKAGECGRARERVRDANLRILFSILSHLWIQGAQISNKFDHIFLTIQSDHKLILGNDLRRSRFFDLRCRPARAGACHTDRGFSLSTELCIENWRRQICVWYTIIRQVSEHFVCSLATLLLKFGSSF